MTKSDRTCYLKFATWLIITGLLVATQGNCSLAQIVPERTLGSQRSIVKPDVIKGLPSDRIEGGARRGANLFHSFREFNIDEGRGAYFSNPSGVQNILTRVTGTNASNIGGVLGVLGNANLFLINPNGIIFGQNASLDVKGSFVATTANAVQFGDRGLFSASNPNSPPLLTIKPSAFLFNQIAGERGSIKNNSEAFAGLDPLGQEVFGLRVPDGQRLLLLGGDVNINGSGLYAYGGRVELGGISGEGTVKLNAQGNSLTLSFPNGVERADVLFDDEAEVNVRSDGGGSITINSQNLSLFGGSKLRAGIASGLGTLNSQAGEIKIDALGVITLTDESFIANVLQREAVGKSGDINIQAESVFLTDGSYLTTSPFGQEGKAGNLFVNALDEVRVSGASSDGQSRITTQTEGSVDAGNLAIATKRLTIENGGQISTATDSPDSEGKAGNLTVNASDEVLVSGVSSDGNEQSRLTTRTESSGDAGELIINTGNLVIENGAQVSSGNNSFDSEGKAGNLTVNASNEVRVSGVSSGGGVLSRLTTRTQGSGDAGELIINTSNLVIENGAQVSSDNNNSTNTGKAGNLTVNASNEVRVSGGASLDGSKQSRLTTRTEGSRDAGELIINTGNLIIENGAQVSSGNFSSESTRESTGDGGNLTVNASNEVRVSGASSEGNVLSRLTTRTQGSGNAGELIINTGNLVIENGAQVSSGTDGFTTTGKGGNLIVNASDEVRVSGSITNPRGEDSPPGQSPSRLTSRTEGSGDAGELTINTGNLVIENGGQVSSGSFNEGRGGLLTVNASESVQVSGSVIENSTDGGTEEIVSRLSTRTRDAGDAGNLRITTKKLLVQDGGQISANTFAGEGQGGLVTIDASDFIELSGTSITGKSSLLSVETNSIGKAGDLTLKTRQLIIEDGGDISSRSNETGIAGNIDIRANSLSLEGEGSSISAETASTDGGNIFLDVQDLLLLRNGSQISTTAGTERAGGNGGDIDINSQFIIAVPSEDSNIEANAFEGRGGNVKITSQGIFGIEFRESETSLSDITASSEFGVAGNVQIDAPDTDPSRRIVNLPTLTVEAEVVQACTPSDTQQSEFVITGRGGLPPSAQEAIGTDAIGIDWVTLNPQQSTSTEVRETSVAPEAQENAQSPDEKHIIEAQGWVVGSDGKVILTAQAPTVTPHIPWLSNGSCKSS
jgi:filamentous hemagglutinin family protein